MTEHSLNGTKISTVHEKIGGKRMTKRMWSDVFGNASKFGVFFDNSLNRTRSKTTIVARGINGV